jgi:hypothetical protein
MRSILRPTAAVVGLAAAALAARPAHAQYEAAKAEVQTFVAPTGGPVRLTAVSMNTFNFFYPWIAGVYAWNGADLSGPNLFRAVLPPRFIPGITLKTDVMLTPGATYAFALFPQGPGAYSFTLAPGELPHAGGGQAYRCDVATGCVSFQDLGNIPNSPPRHILGFTPTFAAAPVTTPEPATLALVAGGLGALGAVTMRRRRATRRATA